MRALSVADHAWRMASAWFSVETAGQSEASGSHSSQSVALGPAPG